MKLTLEMLKKYDACSPAIKRFKKETCDTVELAIKKMQLENLYEWCTWLLARILSRENKIRFAIFAARQVLGIFEKKYPKDARPRQAIEAAKKYLSDPSADAAATASWAAAYASMAATAASWAAADAAYASRAAATAASWAAADAKEKMQKKIIACGMELLKQQEKKNAD